MIYKAMQSPLKNLLFWVGAILIIVLATVFYQPAAAKTGSLLIWMKNRIYVMDIDTLVLHRVGSVGPDEVIAPAPGCMGQTPTPCWVLAGQRLYLVNPGRNSAAQGIVLPIGAPFKWIDAKASWSPDGVHLAYSVLDTESNQAELRLYNASANELNRAIPGVDPTIALSWSADCSQGLTAAGCQLAYKTAAAGIQLVALTPATGEQRQWQVSTERIFELRWSADDSLLFSQPPRHFHQVEEGTPAYQMPAGSQLANLSPLAKYAIYYQPFTTTDCQAQDTSDCLHLGVWLSERGNEAGPRLIYNLNLAHSIAEGINFIPSWSHKEDAAVFFQNGRLIHYDLEKHETTVWYKTVRGKLRSAPIFSPNEAAVAFIDNQGQGYSEYRLVIVNPKLKPIEHIVETETGIRLLAWLPQ